MSVATAAHTRSLSDAGRQPHEWYRTPEYGTQKLLEVERFLSASIWEPACGCGAISRVLEAAGHSVLSTDLHDTGYGEPGRDFLTEPSLLAPGIITNPPFALADRFALHALSLGAEKLALFGRLAWLEGQARHRALWSAHPPVRVWVFAKRLTLWRGDDPNARNTGGATAYAWVVWQRGYRGTTTLGWLA